MKYLLDSNTFIQAKNTYYSMSICPGYWEWILMKQDNKELCSIDFVMKELIRGNDNLAQWAKDNGQLFIPSNDKKTQINFRNVADHARTIGEFEKTERDKFMKGADPWLIAKAITIGATIVTHEKLDVRNKKKISIPLICREFDVGCINTFDLLSRLKAKFIMA